MDPEANLKEQLELASELVEYRGDNYDAARLAELVLSLHEWIAREGFLPEVWRKAQERGRQRARRRR